MIQIRRFLILLACIAFTIAAWQTGENIYFKTYGDKHTGIVTKVWRESATDFRFIKSTILHHKNTNHVEIALVDNTPDSIEPGEWDTKPQEVAEFKSDNIKSDTIKIQLAERLKNNREQLNKTLQAIQDSLKTPAIPENTPRYSIHNITDEDTNHLYAGKKVDIYILGQTAKLNAQVESIATEREQILVALGTALLALSFGLKFIKQSETPKNQL